MRDIHRLIARGEVDAIKRDASLIEAASRNEEDRATNLAKLRQTLDYKHPHLPAAIKRRVSRKQG